MFTSATGYIFSFGLPRRRHNPPFKPGGSVGARIGHASAEGCQKSWTSLCSRSPESTSCCLLCHHLHTMSLGTHSRQGNTGRPRSEAALLESKLDDSWIASLQSRGFFLLLHAAPTLPRPRPRARILANPARNPGRPTKAPTLPPGLKGGS